MRLGLRLGHHGHKFARFHLCWTRKLRLRTVLVLPLSLSPSESLSLSLGVSREAINLLLQFASLTRAEIAAVSGPKRPNPRRQRRRRRLSR